MHMAEPTPLKASDPVAAGQLIGFVGGHGRRADGCHLHFELGGPRRAGTRAAPPFDPLPLLEALPGA